MGIIILFLILEGLKKLWFETSPNRTRENIYKLHVIFLLPVVLGLILSFHSFADTISGEGSGFVIRPKDVQHMVDIKQTLRYFFFSNVTVLLVVVLPSSIYHSVYLYRKREIVIQNAFKTVGARMAKVLMYVPLGLVILVPFSLYLDYGIDSEVESVFFTKIIFFMIVVYVSLIIALYRLEQVGEYEVSWIRVMLRFLLSHCIAFVLLFFAFIVLLANTDFSH